MTLTELFVKLKSDKIDFGNLSEDAQARLLLAAIRIHTSEESLDVAQRDYNVAEMNYRDACVLLQEDDDDSFEEALAKAEQWARIERAFEQASRRLGFERRELARSKRLIKSK